LPLVQLVDLLFVRQRWTFLATFLAAFLAAAAVTFTLPNEYRATSTLFVGENRPTETGASAVQLDDILARTYASLLQTSDVERDIIRALPYKLGRDEVAGKIEVEVVTGTRLIRISTLDQNPLRAQQLVNTYASTFVKRRRQSTAAAGKARLADLDKSIGELTLAGQMLVGQTDPQVVARRAQIRTQLEAARDSYKVTQQSIALQGSDVSVSSNATLPAVPAKPRPKLYLALAFAFALLLAGLLAVLRNLFDQRVRDEEELSAIMSLPVLARIPRERGSGQDDNRRNEAFDILRANLQARDPDGLRSTLAVSSAAPSEGKSTVTARLATAFSRVGQRVVAVDCDLRRPVLGKYLENPAARGVTNLLVEARREPQDLVVPSAHAGVEILPSGPIPPSPAVLLGLPRLGDIFHELHDSHDVVLVDTPPVSVGADTMAVLEVVDGLILVVDLEKSRKRTLVAVRDQLAAAGPKVLGIVLNRTSDRDTPAYDYSPSKSGKGEGRLRRAKTPA